MRAYLCRFISTFVIMFWAVGLFGCDVQSLRHPPRADAVVQVRPTIGNSVSGVVTFVKVKDGVRVIGDLENLTPGSHGIHIHEFGDCRADNGSSAGGHYNPTNQAHGAPDAQNRHAGDLGNVVADENGVAKFDFVDSVIAVDGENSIVGRSVVIHAGEDDFKTQPHGGAGVRVGCGAIGWAAK